MDWKLKLMQILECMDEEEGTWQSQFWEKHGITEEEGDQIVAAYAEFRVAKGDA